MKADYFISYKYLFSKTKYNLVSFISKFSIIVLTLAYFAFFTILSVFSGLEDYSLKFSKSFDPDIKIEPVDKSYILSKDIDSLLLSYKGIEKYSKVVKGNVVVQFEGKTEYAELYGVDDYFNDIIQIDSIISVGRYPMMNSQEGLTSYGLASNLDLILYNPSGIFEIFSVNPKYPEETFNPIGNTKRIICSGVFTPRNDLNGNFIIVDIKTARDLFAINEVFSSEILIKSRQMIKTSSFLKEKLPSYKIRTHRELNESLYKIMNSEKLIVSLIMLLIVFVSTFNVVASTIMLIVEKESDIKTMSAIGMNKKNINSIFFKHNFMLNSIGGLIGLALSIFLICVQLKFSLFKIPGLDISYPVALKLTNVLFVLITVAVTGLCSAYISSSMLKKN